MMVVNKSNIRSLFVWGVQHLHLLAGCGILLVFPGLCFGQLDSARHWLQEAEAALERQEFDLVLEQAGAALPLFEATQEDSASVKCMHLIAKAWRAKGEIPNALRFYLQALKITEDMDTPAGLIPLHLELAGLYEEWSVHEKAFEHFATAQQLASFVGDTLNIGAISLEGMARSQYAVGELAKALGYYQRLHKLYKGSGKVQATVEMLRHIIKICKEQEALEQALAYNETLLELNEQQKDTAEIIVSLNNIGVLNQQLDDFQRALPYFTRSAALESQFSSTGGANPITLVNIGILYQNLGHLQNSLQHLFAAEMRLREIEPIDLPMLANVNNLIAIAYLNTNDLNQAYFYNQKAIDLAQSINDKQLLQLCYKTRSTIYEQINNFKDALDYYRLHTQLYDSLQLADVREREAILYRRFSAEQTEKEMNLLMVGREIEQLKLQQDQLENERLLQETALQEITLEQERLERIRAEQDLRLTQEAFQRQQTENALLLAQQQLETEQKDRQITLLEKEQSQQTLQLTQQRLEAEQKDREIAQSARRQAELNLTVREQDFILKNQREKIFRNTVLGILFTSFVVLALVIRHARLRRRANKILGQQKQELETALKNLQQAQIQLVQSEKMASLGELTAGIAHEINNPLNFVSTNAHALKIGSRRNRQSVNRSAQAENGSFFETNSSDPGANRVFGYGIPERGDPTVGREY